MCIVQRRYLGYGSCKQTKKKVSSQITRSEFLASYVSGFYTGVIMSNIYLPKKYYSMKIYALMFGREFLHCINKTVWTKYVNFFAPYRLIACVNEVHRVDVRRPQWRVYDSIAKSSIGFFAVWKM